MSEYTSYSLVKNESLDEVQKKLSEAKLISIIDDWGGQSKWCSVALPFDDFSILKGHFNTYLHYFEEENWKDWSLNVHHEGQDPEKRLYADEDISFTEEEKKFLEKSFDVEFSKMEPFLKPGGSGDFFKLIEAGWWHMLDEGINMGPKEFFEENGYCIKGQDLE